MRISDWSSDVCSSDLVLADPELAASIADEVGTRARQVRARQVRVRRKRAWRVRMWRRRGRRIPLWRVDQPGQIRFLRPGRPEPLSEPECAGRRPRTAGLPTVGDTPPEPR